MVLPARYHDVQNRIKSGVDHLFAEPIGIFYLKGAEPDPDRDDPEDPIEAILRVGSTAAKNMSGGTSKSWNSRIAAEKAELHIDHTVYETLALKKGDKIRALSRGGEPFFMVEYSNVRAKPRTIVHLSIA